MSPDIGKRFERQQKAVMGAVCRKRVWSLTMRRPRVSHHSLARISTSELIHRCLSRRSSVSPDHSYAPPCLRHDYEHGQNGPNLSF